MALDPKELQQLAGLLGDVLAPRIREAVSENVAVRIAALAQTLRDEQRGALDALQLTTARLVGESTEALSQKVFENGVQSKELLSTSAGATKVFIEEQISTLDEKVAAKFKASEEQFEALTQSFTSDLNTLNAGVAEVRRLIPTVPPIPEPTKLLEAGELSAPMRAAMDVAMRQVMKPVFETMLAPIAEGLSNVETGLTAHSEAVASIARAASKDVDVLNVRVASELDALAKASATKEELSSAVDEARIKLAEAKSEMSAHTENAVRVVSEDMNALSSLAKSAATSEELKTLDSAVAEAIVKTRAEVLAEIKGEVEALESTTEVRLQSLIGGTKRLQDAFAGHQQAAAVALESNIQVTREEILAELKREAEVLESALRVYSDATNERIESLTEDTKRLQTYITETAHAAASVQVHLEEGLRTVRDDAHAARVISDEITAEKLEQTQARIEHVKTSTDAAIAAARAQQAEGAKEIVEEVATRLITLRASIEDLTTKQVELESVQLATVTATNDTAAEITGMIKAAVAAADSAHAEVLESIKDGKAQASTEIQAVRTVVSEEQHIALVELEKRLTTENTLNESRIATTVESQTERFAEIVIGFEATKRAVDSRFETLETTDRNLALEIKAVANDATTAVNELTRRAVGIEAKATEAETRAADLAAKVDKRIEAAHTRVKEVNSEINRKLDAARIATEANADAIATQTAANQTADALAVRMGETLAERAVQIELRIEAVADKFVKDIDTIQEKFTSEIESTRVHIDSSIRTLSDSVEHDQMNREAISYEKTLESIAGARIEAQGSVDALRTEHAAAQERMEAEYARLDASLEDVTKRALKQALDNTTLVTEQLKTLINHELDTVRATDVELTKMISSVESKTAEQFKEFGRRASFADQLRAEQLAAELPDKVKAAVEAFDQPLRAAAREQINLSFESALPNLLAQAREAATATVPDLVIEQTAGLPDALRAALVPLAVAEATRVATEAGEAALGAARGLAEGALVAAKAAGESAIEQARGEAAGAAQMAALAAAEGLRETLRADLLGALDPAERIAKTVAATVPLEVQDAVRKHVGELEPRLYIDLAAKIQKEIDRIPRPRDGRDGDAGKHGKDARVMPPVPYEHGKRYDFGAWVAHANGVWVAARSTDAEPIADSADWDCVTPGIKAIETVLQDDGRTVELHFELTNGALHKSTLKMPVQIPRGVFDAEREYDVHDLCTFDGSQWVALKTGKLARPGLDASWKLQVKHGKDGKDLKQPAPQVIRHAGEWQPDTEYPTNVTVDHAGVRWLAMRSTRERPPFTTLTSNDTWTKLGS